MSADNGVYILETPTKDGTSKEYRVAHKETINNIYQGSEYLVSYFGESKIFTKIEEAYDEAIKIYRELTKDSMVVVYGIQKITMKKPFPDNITVEEANKLLGGT